MRDCARPQPAQAVQNVTTHPSTAMQCTNHRIAVYWSVALRF